MPEYYDSPIHVVTNEIHGVNLALWQAVDNAILQAVQKVVGVDIDEKGLTEVLNQDKKRYEEAYQKGWRDCEEAYKEKLSRIKEIAGE